MKFFNKLYGFQDTRMYDPEFWAEESVRILFEEMVYAGIVHRDFDNKVAKMGDVVHTRKPHEMDAQRKQNPLEVLTEQEANATDIPVPLNQLIYVSFLIGDEEESKGVVSLIEEFLEPAVKANARMMDRCVGGQVYQFLDNAAGNLGGLTKANSHDVLLDTREVLNDLNNTQEDRWLGLASRSETLLQKNELFKAAQSIGDSGEALRKAMLGQVAGFNTFLELNTPSVRGAVTRATTTTTASVAVGSTTIPVTAVTNINIGDYITVAGDMTPLRVTNIATLDLTVNRATKYAIASGAVVTPYETNLVNQASAIAAARNNLAVTDGYPAGWRKPIVYDGSGTPKVGQLVSFTLAAGAAGDVKTQEYSIVNIMSGGIVLDQPLVDAIDDNAIINLGPNGDFNFALKRNAVAMVNRPMYSPMGARSFVAEYNNMALRVTISYVDGRMAQRVTVDGLYGVAPLDTAQGAVMLG